MVRSMASAVAGAGLLAGGAEREVEEHKTSVTRSKVHLTPFIETIDGVSLFYRSWGAGRTVVFLAPWALHSDWWEYQMAFLSGKGLRCIAYDRRGHGRSAEPGGASGGVGHAEQSKEHSENRAEMHLGRSYFPYMPCR